MKRDRALRLMKLFQVSRDLDDTLADCLLLAGFHGSQMPSGDIGLWRHVGFEDLNDRFRFQHGKICCGSFTSAAVAAFDSEIIALGGSLCITKLVLAPLLKSAICCAIYAAGRPVTLEFSGPPGPSAR